MPTTDITKKYRISSQLSSILVRAVDIGSIAADIYFNSKTNNLNLNLTPIVLNIKEKTIFITMKAGLNDSLSNFSDMPSEWFEYIEATFALVIDKYLNKDLS